MKTIVPPGPTNLPTHLNPTLPMLDQCQPKLGQCWLEVHWLNIGRVVMKSTPLLMLAQHCIGRDNMDTKNRCWTSVSSLIIIHCKWFCIEHHIGHNVAITENTLETPLYTRFRLSDILWAKGHVYAWFLVNYG